MTAGGTRLIMMGDAALCAGFDLIGFETWPDATEEELEEVLASLRENGEAAMVFLEPRLARCDCEALRQLQHQGGQVVITEIPPLSAPGDYQPQAEDLVNTILGKQ